MRSPRVFLGGVLAVLTLAGAAFAGQISPPTFRGIPGVRVRVGGAALFDVADDVTVDAAADT